MYRLYVILFLFLICNVLQVRAQNCQPEGNLIRLVSVRTNPVDGSEQTYISWNTPADISSVVGYIIYKYVGVSRGCTAPIDTVYGPAITNYTCNGFNPEGYTIAVYHGATSPGTLQQHHVPPIIHTASYDSCNYTVSLSWSPYIGWDEADILYHVYAVTGGQTQQLAGYLTDTSFLWQDVPDNTAIDLYIQAVHKNDASAESKSPYRRITTVTLQRPAFIDLSRLDYVGDEVRLNFHIDPGTALTQFEIQRAADADFETRHSFPDKTLATYTDNAAGIFRYRVAAKNDCNQTARASDTLQNFILGVTLQNSAWQLQWSRPVYAEPYVFSLQRLVPNPAVLLANAADVSFTDPVSSMQNQQSLEYCYRLEASTPRSLSVSEACAFYEPRIAMPDAIDPLSMVVNPQTGRARNQFGPVLNVHPATYAYQLKIINRNGAKIADVAKGFNDNPLEKSWNGRFANGVAVPEEVYTYYLEVQFEGGRSESLTGPVMVMYE
ncbi:MAG: hypothetical protein LBD52_07405 [Prevotellaceae bacterium]|jgi:hypothetical protein|nr:hypothetical protein [Prevotellaceae bacterium]